MTRVLPIGGEGSAESPVMGISERRARSRPCRGRPPARRGRSRSARRSRPAAPPMVAAKTVVSDPAARVDHRAAGVALAHQPAQRGDQAPHRPAPVRVLGDRLRVSPTRPARTSNGPFSREAEDRRRGARRRGAARATAPARRARRRAGSRCRCGGRRGSPARQARSVAVHQHDRVVLAGDDVRVGHDDARARHPARALDAEPAGGAEDLHDARPTPPARPGRAAIAPVGGGDVGARARRSRERVEARQRVEDRPGRRQQRVEALEHDRALDVVAQLARARRLERDRAQRSTRSRSPMQAVSTAPSSAVEHAEAGDANAPRAARTPRPSRPDREQAAERAARPARPNSGA